MNFTYTAKDSHGRELTGSIEAPSPDDATQLLRRQGLAVVEIEEEDDGAGLFPRSVKKAEIIYTTSQLAVMVDTGITLSQALDSIAQQNENPTLKAVLLDLKKRVEEGEDFSACLARYPRYFDKTFVALVKASEETGTLGEMLERIATYLRKELETISKVRGAMAYPGVMAFIAVGVTIFLLTYILPKFEPLFTSKGVKLPTITVFMMTASDCMLHYWFLWLAGGAAVIGGYIFGSRTEAGRQAIDFVKINLPIIGPLCRKVTISRSIRTLGTMMKSGVSVLDALRLCAEISGNIYYEKAWLAVVDSVVQGNRICDSLMACPLFPRTLVQMIGAGEDTGKLDYVLEKVSNFYDQEVDVSIKSTTSLIEPIMICVMGFVVGGIALGLLLPIFQLSRAH